MVPLLLLAAGCDSAVPTVAPTATAAAPAAEPPAAATTPTEVSQSSPTVDLPPTKVSAPEIASREDIDVNGTPGCSFDVRYVDAVDQPAIWNGEGCKAVRAEFVTAAQLTSLGRLAALDEETRDDIARAGDRVFYVEGAVGSAIYPLNSAKRVYKVMLGD